ncbi:MAG: hypothetical protein AABW65_00650 [Nanoarchaeota archaeon]
MKIISLLLSLIGISILLLLLFLPPKHISSLEELSKLKENQKTSVSGKVINERLLEKSTILKLDNNIELLCDCPKNIKYKGKNITAVGIKDSFLNKDKIIVLKLKYDN